MDGGVPAILDTFMDGGPGTSWTQENTSGWIESDAGLAASLSCGGGTGCPGALQWKVQTFGVDQAVFLTIARLPSAGEIELLLKQQPGAGGECNAIYVTDVTSSDMSLHVGWSSAACAFNHVASFPCSLASGDVIGAVARQDGQVEVYLNGTRLGCADLSTVWPSSMSTGAIGLYGEAYTSAVGLIDFRGGDVAP
jgi:hypothetical protein